MASEVEEYRRVISAFVEGRSDVGELSLALNEIRRADTRHLGAAEAPVREVIGLLNVYRPTDGVQGLAGLRHAIEEQYGLLRAITGSEVKRGSTVADVVRHLTDPDPDVRIWAAGRAGQLPTESALTDALRTSLLDPDPRVARIAALALARRGDIDSLEQIGNLLFKDLSRPFRLELWALFHLVEGRDPGVIKNAVAVIDRYLREGGAAKVQATEYLRSLGARQL